MRAQGLDRVETARQFGFGQGGVHLFVADLMQQNGRSALASFEFWDQMMQAAAPSGIGRPQSGQIGSLFVMMM